MTPNMEMIFNQTKAMIETVYKDKQPTADQIYDQAQSIRNAFSITGMCVISDEEFEQVKKELSAHIVHSIGYASTLRSRDEDNHEKNWYVNNQNDHFFWIRYAKYLGTKWNQQQVQRLNKTTDDIMDELGDPNSDSTFQRRGLLLGDVQSGKTATYTAICNKAADCGYKVIIVLAGLMENLRVQTQERLDAEFVGLDSKYSFDKKADSSLKNVPVGVGKYRPFESDLHITRFTSVTCDFQKRIVSANGLNLKDLRGTALFVVKKNKSILNNLQEWLTKDEPILDLPMLLIDDECDNASVNTNKKDAKKTKKVTDSSGNVSFIEETDRTAINHAINNLLLSFKQASYLGITATPFANIFIEDTTEANGAAGDLYPKDFITLLPTPDHYIGVDKMFGHGDLDNQEGDRVDAVYDNSLIKIDDDEQVHYFRYKHSKELAHALIDLPTSLEEAIRYFILVTAICDYRYDTKEHRSMLVNVSRFTDVQNKLASIVAQYVSDIAMDVESYAQLPANQARRVPNIAGLEDTWNKFKLTDISGITWACVLKKHLTLAAKRIVVKAVNRDTGAKSLDYYNYKNQGMRVIAIGGNSLSRGLTLEGLIVSYFYRNTAMYDTLLQMGRWFGYRPNYDDLFRIWMGEETINWYGYITDAYNDLKEQFRTMARQNMTPREFGFRVRQNPGVLMITAKNKMREGTQIEVPITLTGRMIETPRLLDDVTVIKDNNAMCIESIFQIDALPGVTYELAYDGKAHLWRNVPKKYVVDMVRSYKCHPWNLNFQPMVVADYIEQDDGELEYWDVAIPNGSRKIPYDIRLSNRILQVYPEPRPITRSSSINKMLTVNSRHVRIGAGGCAKIGLTQSEIDRIRGENKSVKDSIYLECAGRRPICLIHYMHNSEELDGYPSEISALGLGFPGSKSSRKAVYVVTKKELENYIDTEDLEDNGDDI